MFSSSTTPIPLRPAPLGMAWSIADLEASSDPPLSPMDLASSGGVRGGRRDPGSRFRLPVTRLVRLERSGALCLPLVSPGLCCPTRLRHHTRGVWDTPTIPPRDPFLTPPSPSLSIGRWGRGRTRIGSGLWSRSRGSEEGESDVHPVSLGKVESRRRISTSIFATSKRGTSPRSESEPDRRCHTRHSPEAKEEPTAETSISSTPEPPPETGGFENNRTKQ